MPGLGYSINSISTFGFIMVLGMLVDDAIVVGENVYTYQQRGEDWLAAAIRGTSEVTVPVIFGVLTTVAAFSPLLSVPGTMGQIMSVIAHGRDPVPALLGHRVAARAARAPRSRPRSRGRRFASRACTWRA